MLVQEILEDRPDLIKTYSDDGHYVVNQDGVQYGEAIDPLFLVENGTRIYTESEELMPVEDEDGTPDSVE